MNNECSQSSELPKVERSKELRAGMTDIKLGFHLLDSHP
jgi:hypothetical protein